MTTEEKSNEAPASDVQNKKSPLIVVVWITLTGTIVSALLSSPIIENWLDNAETIEASLPPITQNYTSEPENPVTLTETIIPTVPLDPFIGTDGMQLIEIPAGEFLMGSKGTEPDERPVHAVLLDAFLIDQTEVTNAMYALCVGTKNVILQNLILLFSKIRVTIASIMEILNLTITQSFMCLGVMPKHIVVGQDVGCQLKLSGKKLRVGTVLKT